MRQIGLGQQQSQFVWDALIILGLQKKSVFVTPDLLVLTTDRAVPVLLEHTNLTTDQVNA